MGKRKKSKSTGNAISSSIASRRLLQLPVPVALALRSVTLKTLSDRLTKIEDRRTWSPLGPKRSARSFNKAHHTLVVKKPRLKSAANVFGALSHKVRFAAPRKVLVCVRRQARKEVIFAKGKNGRGVRRRNPKRNWFSSVSCRR